MIIDKPDKKELLGLVEIADCVVVIVSGSAGIQMEIDKSQAKEFIHEYDKVPEKISMSVNLFKDKGTTYLMIRSIDEIND